jgi:predicted exporter
LGTIPFYLTEAAILAVLFFPGLRYHPIYAILGFSAGAALFFFVMPLLNVLRTIRHVEPWHAGEEIPQWVKGHDAKEAVNA